MVIQLLMVILFCERIVDSVNNITTDEQLVRPCCSLWSLLAELAKQSFCFQLYAVELLSMVMIIIGHQAGLAISCVEQAEN
jgi:hypothetical protein